MFNNYQFTHIQSLRAVSVFAVFLFHLNLEMFKNGYLGVDIFFVISGYVITSRIYTQYQREKKIEILDFFVKRLKRIYPILVFFLTICLIVFTIFSPLDNFLERARVIAFSIFGLSNFYYLFNQKDYFDNIYEDPLSHTWSLGIEEQFYLIYPFLFLFLFHVFKKNRIKNVIKSFVGISLFLLVLNFLYQENNKLVFYFPIFRFWQFLIGAIFFFLSVNFIKKNNFLFLISLSVLIYIVFFDYNLSNFNKMLISTLASGIFIFTYKKNSISKILLENNILIYYGNISYSFYLWHLPVIYFYNLYFSKSLLIFDFFAILIFTTLISNFTYLYIEQKFRYYKVVKLNYFYLISVLVFFTCSVFALYFLSNQKSFENKFKFLIKNEIYKINYLERKYNYSNRFVFYKININGNEIYRYCTDISSNYKINNLNLRSECLKNNKKNKLFYLNGNSHVAQFVPIFDKIDNDNFYYSHKDTNGLMDVNLMNTLAKSFQEIIYVTSIDQIINLKTIKSEILNLSKNVKILVLGPIPNFNQKNLNPLNCVIKKITCSFDTAVDFKKRNIKNIYEEVEEIKFDHNDKFLFYSPYKKLCPKRKCLIYDQKKDLLFIEHIVSIHINIRTRANKI